MLRRSTLLTAVLLCFTAATLIAQLPDGTQAPNFTLTDINGNTHDLHDLLDQGKTVVLKFSATWCGPCWNYHNTHAMRDFYDSNGPAGSDQSMAYYIECDLGTGLDDLMGNTPGTQGDWVTGTPYPIIDLQSSTTASDFSISYYPTIYKVCPDGKIYEVGQAPAATLTNWIQSCNFEVALDGTSGTNCYGEGEGSASLIVGGGYGTPNYSWSNGAHTPTLENVEAGTYHVTVSDDNGRTEFINDIIIDGPETPIEVTSLEISDLYCNSDGSGSISIEAEGGNGVSQYEWSTGDNSPSISNLPAGMYSVTITDVDQCSVIEFYEVFEPEVLEASYAGQTAHCGSADGSITVSPVGGTGPYTLTSDNGIVNGHTVTGLPAGEYEIVVSDANGCEFSFSESIGDAPPPDVSINQPEDISCLAPSQTITASITYDGNDLSYTWLGPDGVIAGAVDPSIIVTEPGVYSIIVEDLVYGCETEATVEISGSIDSPEVELGDDLALDCGQLSHDIAAVISNAGEEYTISWTTTDGSIVSDPSQQTVTVDEPGTYVVAITNTANGCTSSDEVIVTDERSFPTSGFSFDAEELSVVFSNQSTGEGISYSWSFGDGNTSSEAAPQHEYSTSGVYNVCLTVMNGCGEATTCFDVLVEASASAVQVGYVVTHLSCNGAANGSIQLNVQGGVSPYTFEWAGPNGYVNTIEDITDLTAGTYVVIVTDSDGSQKQVSVIVTEPEELVTETELNSDLWGYSIDLEVTGGTPPYLYLWSNGASTEDLGNLPEGEYFCQVIDANGCLIETETIVVGKDIGTPEAPEWGRDIRHIALVGNPSVQPLQITVTGSKINTEHTFQLVSVSGVVVESGKWYGNVHSVDLRGNPTGIYMLVIYDRNGWISTEKLFIAE